MPGLSMGRAGHCHHPLPAQRLPLLGDSSLARQAPTGFLVLLPKLEGQLDVPKHHRSTVLAHSSSVGCREPLLWWSRMRASPQQKASIFSPLFPVDFTLASAVTATPPLVAGKWGEGWLAAGAEQQGSRAITDFPVISLLCFRLTRANFPVSIRAANLTPPAQSHRKIHMHQETYGQFQQISTNCKHPSPSAQCCCNTLSAQGGSTHAAER